jgi:uncharacterized protein (DUF2267 family)
MHHQEDKGWKPSTTLRKLRTLEDFLGDIPLLPCTDETFDAEKAVRSIFMLLDHRISEGEIEDIRYMLPEEVRSLWPNQ